MIEFFTRHDGEIEQLTELPFGFDRADGSGVIFHEILFDGVSILRMHLEMHAYMEHRGQPDVLEINFCAAGRFESDFSQRDRVLLKPGDMAISCYDGVHGTESESRFPLGYYEGICLEIEPKSAQTWLSRNAPAFPVDFRGLKENILGNKWYYAGPAGPRCEHVFRELYENATYSDLQYLRLEVLELLMLLRCIPREDTPDGYCNAGQIELVRHLRDHLVTDRENYSSLDRLAEEHHISVSHLQKLFKQVYGVPIYRYLKEYRLEQAAVELVQSGKSITVIAQDAGYDNASKFTETFKKRYGTTPSNYRRKMSIKTE